ncbi:MAG TPA: TAXI family TRAP transporter solute-binding subunit [Gemmatales bacterium]|nr:TAXI family TRAP transporter solute-binding subunit [Gemmatales bacterium]
MISTLKKNKPLFRRVRLGLVVLGCLMVGLGAYFTWSHFISDEPVTLRISTGRTVARRYQLAEQLRDCSHSVGIHLNLISTAGSEAALHMVGSGELDLAIVSSGILSTGKANVRELAAFSVEPAHFLIRKELADKGGLLRDMIRGKRVNLGEQGSSDNALARELLAFAHMSPGTENTPGDFIATNWSPEELTNRSNEIDTATGAEKARLINALPDAMILVASMPSKVAQEIIEAADYRLITLAFSRAFILNTNRNEAKLNTAIDHSYIEQTVIPAGSYLGTRPAPMQDCETIGMRLLLVANKNVPTGAIYRLMGKVFEGEFARKYKPTSPTEKDSPYDVHLGALAYLNRNKPYILNEVVEYGKKVMSIFGLFSAGALSFFALLRTRKNKSAGDYLKEIRQIELIARGLESDSEAPRETVALAHHLDERLAKLKSELIHACCNKEFKNEMMLLNILTILVDTRQQVGGLLTQGEGRQAEVKREEASSVLKGKWKKAS